MNTVYGSLSGLSSTRWYHISSRCSCIRTYKALPGLYLFIDGTAFVGNSYTYVTWDVFSAETIMVLVCYRLPSGPCLDCPVLDGIRYRVDLAVSELIRLCWGQICL